MKLVNTATIFAMLSLAITPFVTKADVVPRQMTLNDDGLFLFVFERILKIASPSFGLTWVDVAVVAIGSAILLFLIARTLMTLEFSRWKIWLLWAFPLCTCSSGILWIIGFAYDCRESLALLWCLLIGGTFIEALYSLISKDTPRWFWRYCSLVLLILLLPLVEVLVGEYLPGLADMRKSRRVWLEDHCYKCGSGLVGPYRWKQCPNCTPSHCRERKFK